MKVFMKNTFVLCLFLVFSFNNLHAQDAQKADSLLVIYNNVESDIPLKVKVLGELYQIYLYSDREKAKEYLATAKEISEKNDYKKGTAFCRFQKGVLFHLRGERDSASIYYLEAVDFYQKINDKKMIAKARGNMASIAYFSGDYQKAKEITETCLREDSINSYGYNIALLSDIYWSQGNFESSLEMALVALKYHRKKNNTLEIGDMLETLGRIESELKNKEKAMEYHSEAIEIFRSLNNKSRLGNSILNLGMHHLDRNNLPKAKELIEESLLLLKEMENERSQGIALNALGKIAKKQRNLNKAITYMEEGLALQEKRGSRFRIIESLKTIARTYYDFDQPQSALPYVDRAVIMADTISNLSARDVYKLRARVHEKMNQHALALVDFKKFHGLSDSILNKEKIAQIEELRVQYDTENKEKEIALLSKNAELEAVKKNRLWTMLAAAIGIGSILLWSQWQRRRKEKMIHQKEKEIEMEKRKFTESENQRLNQALDFKKQELTSKVLQLCRKNEFLQSLNKDVKDFKVELEGVNKRYFDQLSRKINRDMDADADWEEFLKSFETVHPDFKKILLQLHPDLSPNEIRMAYLMRMNLESKDIANLLNITNEGVKKARHRMRKKMNKDSSVNLTEYLMNLDN